MSSQSFFNQFNQLLLRRPFLTNMVTTGFLFGSGDYLAQTLFTKPENHEEYHYDYPRTIRAVIFGSIVFAPIGDKWYKLLGRIKAPTFGGGKINPNSTFNKMKDTVARVGVDQLIFAPFIGIPLYYSVMTLFEFKPIETISYKLQKNWWNTLVSNWTVWPIFQWFNFYLTPVHYRLLAVNVFSIGWNCYLSYLLNNKDSSDPLNLIEEAVEEKDQVKF